MDGIYLNALIIVKWCLSQDINYHYYIYRFVYKFILLKHFVYLFIFYFLLIEIYIYIYKISYLTI